MFNKLLQAIVKHKSPILFDDLHRTKPISGTFGEDRGTPIDRYYIEQFLSRNSEYIKGNVLEIAENKYCSSFGGESVLSCDVLHNSTRASATTIIGDLTQPETLPTEKYDCFVCTQTLNFIYDIQAAVSGAHQVLKPGGVMLATVAGICQISRFDMDRWGDYWRFTTKSIYRLLEPVFTGGVVVVGHGNVLAAKALLDGLALEDLPDSKLLDDYVDDYQVLIGIIAHKK